MENKTRGRAMLFDFFGELLTEKQRDYYDLYHNEDLSLSEIAESGGVSRQSVFDTITRAEKTLENIERKTGVIARFESLRIKLERAQKLADDLHQTRNEPLSQELAEFLRAINRELISE